MLSNDRTLAEGRAQDHARTLPTRSEEATREPPKDDGGKRSSPDAETLPGPSWEEVVSRIPSPASGRLRVVEHQSYDIRGEIAQGGIGRIWRAHDNHLDRPVAVKEVIELDPATEARFVREARITAKLQHPSIVPVYEAGRWPSGEPFFTMKLVNGRSLDEVIAEAKTLDARLALLPHVIDVAEAMAYAHNEGIVHRDLKPQNVLAGPFGETVVIDWGLAKDLREREEGEETPAFQEGPPSSEGPPKSSPSMSAPPLSPLTVVGVVMGTPAYMPPEQAAGRLVDERADVYAIGAILYHLLAGKAPYGEARPMETVRRVLAGPPPPVESFEPGVPRELLTIQEKAMARKLSDRYRTAGDLALDLRRFQAGQLVGAHHYSKRERLIRFAKKNRVVLLALGAAVLSVAATGALSVRRILDARDEARRERDRATALEKRASERADTLTLVEAQAAVGRDPLEALAWLKTLSPSFSQPARLRLAAADALAHGVPRLFRGHTAGINTAMFSPDGHFVASVSDDRSVRLWDVEKGTARVLSGHTDEVWVEGFSPDSARLATAGKDGRLFLWDLSTGEGKELFREDVQLELSRFTPDGRDIVFWGRGGRSGVWEGRAGRRRVWTDVTTQDLGPALSPDGSTLAFGRAGEVAFVNVKTGEIRSLRGLDKPVFRAAYSPDGSRVVVGGEDGAIVVLDLRDGSSRALERLPGGVHELQFFPDGRRFVSTGFNKSMRLWDIETGQFEELQAHEGNVYALDVSRDGKTLVSGGADRGARIWDVASRTSTVLRGPKDATSDIAFSPDEKSLAVASYDGTLRLYSIDALRDRVMAVHGAEITKIAVSPDGKRSISVGQDGSLVLSSLEGGTSTKVSKTRRKILDIVFSPDGARFAAASAEGSVLVGDLAGDAGGFAVRTFEGHRGAVQRVVFSPDGSFVLSAGEDGAVRRVPVHGGESSLLFSREAPAAALVFSPDGARLAVSFGDGAVVVREMATGEEKVLDGHKGLVSALAFSPSGRLLASGGLDHSVRLWDPKAGASLRVIDAAGTGVQKLVFFPDERRIVTTGGEANVRIWSVDDGGLLDVLRGHVGVVYDVAVSPDGGRIATASNDGTLRLWDLSIGESRVLEGHRGPVRAVSFALSGRAIVSGGDDHTARRFMDDLPIDMQGLRGVIESATPETLESLGVTAD